jgi:hypothetical protein
MSPSGSVMIASMMALFICRAAIVIVLAEIRNEIVPILVCNKGPQRYHFNQLLGTNTGVRISCSETLILLNNVECR